MGLQHAADSGRTVGGEDLAKFLKDLFLVLPTSVMGVVCRWWIVVVAGQVFQMRSIGERRVLGGFGVVLFTVLLALLTRVFLVDLVALLGNDKAFSVLIHRNMIIKEQESIYK